MKKKLNMFIIFHLLCVCVKKLRKLTSVYTAPDIHVIRTSIFISVLVSSVIRFTHFVCKGSWIVLSWVLLSINNDRARGSYNIKVLICIAIACRVHIMVTDGPLNGGKISTEVEKDQVRFGYDDSRQTRADDDLRQIACVVYTKQSKS